jgi:hypothetical protein
MLREVAHVDHRLLASTEGRIGYGHDPKTPSAVTCARISLDCDGSTLGAPAPLAMTVEERTGVERLANADRRGRLAFMASAADESRRRLARPAAGENPHRGLALVRNGTLPAGRATM